MVLKGIDQCEVYKHNFTFLVPKLREVASGSLGTRKQILRYKTVSKGEIDQSLIKCFTILAVARSVVVSKMGAIALHHPRANNGRCWFRADEDVLSDSTIDLKC
jgi:hypothetical protein